MKKTEIIKNIIYSGIIKDLKNDPDVLIQIIKKLSEENPKIFEETINKKIIKTTSSSLLQVHNEYSTEDLMIRAFIYFIIQIDKLYY